MRAGKSVEVKAALPAMAEEVRGRERDLETAVLRVCRLREDEIGEEEQGSSIAFDENSGRAVSAIRFEHAEIQGDSGIRVMARDLVRAKRLAVGAQTFHQGIHSLSVQGVFFFH